MTTHSKTPIAVATIQPNQETVDHDRRKLIGGAAMGLAAASFASLFPVRPAAAATNDEIRPFRIDIPEADFVDLRRRLAATRWPEKETVGDNSQGVPLAMLQDLVRYWQTDYDWRKVEARLNALPQFITEIDGLDIHFIHVRSKHENALPMIVTHGWPGSVIEQMKIIDPLTNPTAHGGSADDAFHLVIPSMPGYGFSGKPAATGWDPQRIARAWITLMKRLGYKKFVAQGGDWGSPVSNEMAKLGAPQLLGIHVNLPGVVPPEILKAVAIGWYSAGNSFGRRKTRLRSAQGPVHQAACLRADHGHAPADPRGIDGFASRSRGLAARPWRRLCPASLSDAIGSAWTRGERTLRGRADAR